MLVSGIYDVVDGGRGRRVGIALKLQELSRNFIIRVKRRENVLA